MEEIRKDNEETIEELPFVAFSNDELEGNGEVGDVVICPNCSEEHKVEYGERVLEDGTKIPSKMLAFTKCDKNEAAYLIGIEGKLLK